MDRITKDHWAMMLAEITAQRATCVRRKVGAVILDRHGHVMSTGYNGPASGMPHCIEHPCPGAECPSGTGLDLCQAIHAEANALLQCKDVLMADSIYVTTLPCVHCMKMLMNTGIQTIVFMEDYAGANKSIWPRKLVQLTSDTYEVVYG